MGKYIYNTQLQDGKPNRPNAPTILFKLQAVIEHSGVINSGHYVAFRRGPSGSKAENKWFAVSDTSVVQCELMRVLASKAYLLFYERIVNDTETATDFMDSQM